MFAKLLKYEWKASAGLLGILSLAALVSGIVGAILLRLIMGYAESAAESDAVSAVLMMPLTLLLLFLFLALAVYMVAVQITLLHRFYKNKFTDEGYLTFTLPVSSHQIFLSSLTNMLVWSLISGLVFGLSILLMMWIGLSGVEGFQLEINYIFGAYEEGMEILQGEAGYATYQLLSVLGAIVEWFSNPVLMLTCITVGAVMAKKHKILTAIGTYYILTMVVGMVTGAFSTIVTLEDYYSSETLYSTNSLLFLGLQILLMAGLAVGGYFLSTHLMTKKLNLP